MCAHPSPRKPWFMARQPLIGFAGAFYHVICRWDREERIFEDDEEQQMFLRVLGECREKSEWNFYARVLMANHYYWVLQTPEARGLRLRGHCIAEPISHRDGSPNSWGCTVRPTSASRFAALIHPMRPFSQRARSGGSGKGIVKNC